MNLRPIHLLIPILGVALALVSPFEKPQLPKKKKKRGAAAVSSVGGNWSNARHLSQLMPAVIEYVTKATGMSFGEEVPGAKPSSVDEVAAFLREDMDAAFRTLGAQDDAGVVAMSRALAGQLIAAYDPKANMIHVLPENAVAAAKAVGDESLTSDDVLKLLMIRMGVIALDRKILPEWKAALDGAKSLDAVHCAGAVLEGHAQYTTERVTDYMVQYESFDRANFDKLVKLLTAPAAAESAGVSQALATEAKFAILTGHKFMKATARKRSFKKVLRQPPTDRNHIFKPAEYLQSFSKAGQVPERIAKEFATALPAADGWAMASAVCPADEVEAWMTPLQRSIWSGEVASYKKGQKFTASKAGAPDAMIWLLEFRTGGMAASYVALAKSAVEKGDATTEEGAGRDGGLPGFAATREKDGTQQMLQMTHEGRFVLAFVSGDDADQREGWDDAMEASAEILGKVQKTRKNRRDK